MSSVEGSHRAVIKFFDISEQRAASFFRMDEFVQVDDEHLNPKIAIILTTAINTFAASYLNTQGLNNSCLKSPVSTLVDLTFQSCAVRSFSLNQLRNLSL